MPRKPDDTVQLKLRFPEKLRARIEAEAKKNNRSMNNEILRRLEGSFDTVDRSEELQAAIKAAVVEARKGIHRELLKTLDELRSEVEKP